MDLRPGMMASLRKHAATGSTINEQMAAAGGRASGFDYLRLALATLILFYHVFTQQTAATALTKYILYVGPLYILHVSLVPMFFGLGGYLVAGSLDRTQSLVTFL